MDNQEKNLSPEEKLDALLAQFLEETDTAELSDPSIPMEELDAQVDALLTPDAPAPEAAVQAPAAADPAKAPVLAHPLGDTALMPKIEADEQAVEAAGLIKPEDAQLVDIIEEVKAEEPPVDTGKQSEDTQESSTDTDPATEDTDKEDPQPGEDPVLAVEEAAPEEVILLKKKPKKENTYGFFGLPHIAATLIWLVIVVSIGAAIGNAIWVAASDVLAFGREDTQVTITISEHDDLDAICHKLQTMGLIKLPSLFKLYVQITDDVPVPGTYELNTLYDYHALVKKMRPAAASRVILDVTIPEGYTCQQIFQLLQDKGVCSIADLETAAMTADLSSYWFLEGVARDDKYCLEGFLFPDTYEFYEKDEATRVLKKLLNNFNRRFNDTMADKLTALNITLAEMMKKNGLSEDYIDAHQVTIREIVIVASMIERETSDETEVYKVSSVIYNRLTNPGKYPTLDIDSTLIYITGRNDITEDDKKIDSPYNTYLYPGLTPGAICNPGRTSINAALDPENTNYYFYALDPSTGDHHFSETYAEHQKFLESLKDKKED